MTLVFGWWDWNAEASSLDNRVTGERVVYRGPVDADDSSSSEFWLRFDYVHPELTFPLLVKETVEEWGPNEPRTAWLLDYENSLAFASTETETPQNQPAYGVWRRVDDCVTDALSCWPRPPEMKHEFLKALKVRGGWLNGQWQIDLSRSCQRISNEDSPQKISGEYDPWMIPLDQPPPSPWRFHAFPSGGSQDGNIELEKQVLIDGLEIDRQDSESHLRLAPDSNLTSLEGRTPYLLSCDGQRVLYPQEGDSEKWQRLRHAPPKFRLLYADDDIVCDFFARSHHERDGSALWTIYSLINGFGLRGPGGRMATGSVECALARRPCRRLWLRLQWAAFDGWINWGGTAARCSAWLEDLNLPAAKAFTIQGGYRGGELIDHISTYLNSKPVTSIARDKKHD